MNHSKPDLLLVLVMILGVGVLLTSYGSQFFKGWDVHAMARVASK
jgi:hypothetical protein